MKKLVTILCLSIALLKMDFALAKEKAIEYKKGTLPLIFFMQMTNSAVRSFPYFVRPVLHGIPAL